MLFQLSKIASLAPLPAAISIGRFLGLMIYYLLPIKRRIAFQNVERVFKHSKTRREKRRIVRNCYAQLGMYVMELLRLPMLTPELSEDLIEFQGYEHLDAAFKRGKGVIIAASHMDNIDYAGCSMAIRGIPISVPAREIKWAPAQKFISEVRSRTGVILLPRQRVKEQIKELLKQNQSVTFVVDQHMSQRRAIVCEFFGQLASTSSAPARFALENGAAIVPGVIFRKGKPGHHILRFEPIFELETPYEDLTLNIRHNTERLNRIIEGWILEQPEQWLWLHRRWKVHDHPNDWDIPQELLHLKER
ncbi:lysophospholipid acyltransferase family protein [bacterium]|nr:lysophospholipid acyltransferase family protein [candidate division CSSED10-310 bacterium]